MQVFHIFREVLVHTAQSNRCKSSHKPIFCNTCFVFVLESEGTPSSLPYFHRINRIFHEINHPAIGVPPLMDIPAFEVSKILRSTVGRGGPPEHASKMDHKKHRCTPFLSSCKLSSLVKYFILNYPYIYIYILCTYMHNI